VTDLLSGFEALFGPRRFEVDLKHLLEDIRDHYSFPIPRAVIVENMDNCIDEKYREIHFNVKKGKLEIIMKGDGIPPQVFSKVLPTLSGTTKVRGEGLGHYGWGMKVGLVISKRMIIETKKGNFQGRQVWFLKEGVPHWQLEKPKIMLKEDSTVIIHELDEKRLYEESHLTSFNEEFIVETLKEYYPTLLAGYPVKGRKLAVFVNNKKVEPPVWLSKELYEDKKLLKLKIEDRSIGGRFFLAKKDLEGELGGKIAIIVFGRLITRESFGLSTKRITGYVHADILADIVAADKTNFKRATRKWRKFSSCIAQELSKFAKKHGLIPEEGGLLDRNFMRRINEQVNRVLKNFPNLEQLGIIGTRREWAKVLIEQETGDKPVIIIQQGSQRTEGTIGGPGEGDRVPIRPGLEDEKAPVDREKAKRRAKEEKRRIKRGIEVFPTPIGSNREAWFDLGERRVIVDTEHPSYKAVSRHAKTREYYTIRCALEAILDYLLENEQINPSEYLNLKQEMMLTWGRIQAASS